MLVTDCKLKGLMEAITKLYEPHQKVEGGEDGKQRQAHSEEK